MASREDILSGKWVPSKYEQQPASASTGAPSREDILSGKWQPTIPTQIKSFAPVAPKVPEVTAPRYTPVTPKLLSPQEPTTQLPLIPSLQRAIAASKAPALPTFPTKKPSPAQFVGKNVIAELGAINKGLAQTADLFLPDVITLPTIQKGIGYYKDLGTAQAQAAQETNVQLGKPAEIGGQLIQGTVGAIPNAVLAMMTAGASTAPQLAAQAPKAAGLLSTIGTVTKDLAKNPMFWASFARTTGGTYEEAKAEGASELAAQATAIISGLLNAGVEVGGGVEALPKNLKQGGASAIRTWVNSMIDEGKEEVIQGIIENATKAALYDKSKAFASIQDQGAILNPVRAAKEFGTGAAIGGILGGGQVLAGKAFTPKTPQAITPLQPQSPISSQRAADITQKFSPAQAPITPGLKPQPIVPLQPTAQSNAEITQPTAAPKLSNNTSPLKVPFEEIQDNYLKPISQYTDSIYRETDIDGAIPFIDRNFRVDMPGDYYFSNSPNLARGQGENQGVLIRLKSDGLKGVLNRSKPSFEPAYKSGETEIISRYGTQKTYQDNVESVTIQPGLKGSKPYIARFKRAVSGWTEVKNPDGSTTYIRPTQQAPAIQPAPLQPQPMQNGAGNAPQSVGAAGLGFDPYSNAANTYGTIKPGEKPARMVDVPAQTTDDTKTRQFARTIMEAEAIPETMMSDFEQEIVKGTFAYKPMTDKAAVRYADNTINGKGFNGALTDWEAVVTGNKAASKNDIALGETLLNQAANAGDTKLAMKLAAELAAEGTRAGQNVQALRLLKKMTPDGQLYYLQKTVQNLNTDLLNKLKANAPNVQISKSLAAELLSAQNQQEIDAAVDKITQNIADQIPATWIDKWNAWRYLSMLGNPRTHIRNIVGNGIFVPAVKIKNRIAQGLELLLPKAERTKALTTDKSIRSFAEQDFNAVKESVTGGGKYNPADLIRDKQTIFKTKPLEWARKANLAALEAEDALFLKLHYVDSFASAMKARGLTAEFLGNGTKTANVALENLRSYATQEAQKATYRDASELANLLNRTKRTLSQSDNLGMKAGGVLLEGVMPFTKTPINILKRGVEYSPAGLLNGLRSAMVDVKGGKVSASQAIDQIASGLTGTGIVALGMWLASMGLISGGSKEDKKEQGFERLQGGQNYALKIGDKTYTLDWAAPASLPLFVGVEAFNIMQGENPDKSVSAILDSMTKLTEPMVEMSMLQGMNNTFKAIAYGDSPLSDMAIELAAGYTSQGVPTLAGQVARTIDPLRRSTYIDKNSPLPQFAQKFIQKQQAKIPGLTQGMLPYVDQWGRTQENPSLVSRAAQNFLSPGYVSQSNVTPVDAELDRLYNATGEKSVLPSYADKSIKFDGETINFTAMQYLKYSTEKGQKSHELLDGLITSEQYATLQDDEKVKLVENLYEYSNALAKTKVSDYKLSDSMAKVQQAEELGVKPYDYFLLSGELKKFTPKTDATGKVTATEQQRQYLLELQGMSPEVKQQLDKILIQSGDDKKDIDYSNEYDFQISQWSESDQEKSRLAKSSGISSRDIVAARDALRDIKGDPDAKGGTISGTTGINKRGEIDRLNPGMSFDKREELYRSFGVGLSESAEKTWSYPDVQNAVGSKENYYKVQDLISTIKADKDEYGASISGTAKIKEIEAIAKELNISMGKAEVIHNELVSFKHDISEMSAKQQQSWQDLKAKNMPEKDYIKYVNQMQIVAGDKDANGKTISGSLKKNRYNRLLELGMSDAQARYFLSELFGYKW